jgi:hypothetical protein
MNLANKNAAASKGLAQVPAEGHRLIKICPQIVHK